MIYVQQKLGISERRACAALGQSRGSHRRPKIQKDDEEKLTEAIIRLASQYGRYGYRRITALLRVEGWTINRKRVERIWRREGLKVPQRQKKRRRLYLNDGSCICSTKCITVFSYPQGEHTEHISMKAFSHRVSRFVSNKKM